MTVYIQDDFSDADATSLLSHSPLIGTWTEEWNSDGFIEGNALTNNTFGAESALGSAAPDTPDYQAGMDLLMDGGGSQGVVGVLVRANFSGGINGYFGGWHSGEGGWVIGKYEGSVFTALGVEALPELASPGGQSIIFSVAGDVLSLSVDGSPVVELTDATFSATGEAGVVQASLIQGWITSDNFLASDLSGPPAGEHVVSGRGEFAIDAPGWLKVSVAGRPSFLTSGFAEPPNWYHVGLLSWGTANGIMTAQPITRDLELIALPPGMLRLAYSLANGVTATITEMATA
jgi:hypothetical protein